MGKRRRSRSRSRSRSEAAKKKVTVTNQERPEISCQVAPEVAKVVQRIYDLQNLHGCSSTWTHDVIARFDRLKDKVMAKDLPAYRALID